MLILGLLILVLAIVAIWFALGHADGSNSSRPRISVIRSKAKPVYPDDDEDFLRQVRMRAAEQRRKARGVDESNPEL